MMTTKSKETSQVIPMRILKRILNYLIWTLVAFLFAFGYLLIIIGPLSEPTSEFMKVIDFFLRIYSIYLGIAIGSFIALIYILIDIFYLNTRLKNIKNSNIIRFLTVLIIAIFVGVIHFILEKVIDVI